MCPDRAVVAAGTDPVTGLKGNIAEKQYEVVDVDEKGNVKPGSNGPLVVSDLNPGQQVHIIKNILLMKNLLKNTLIAAG